MFEIRDTVIDCDALRANMHNPAAGALVIFEGRVRNVNEGRAVSSLEYEAYAGMCHNLGQRMLEEAREKFGVLDIQCVHRTGHLQIGDVAVWLGVSDGHRGDAFAACRWLIDEIKRELPIWKREHYVDGPAEWVRCEACAAGHEHHHHKDERGRDELSHS